MAWHFRGNTATLAISDPRDLPMVINSFGLVNKTGGQIVANVYMLNDAQNWLYCIIPDSTPIYVNTMYESERPVVMLAGETIKVQVSDSCDYDFYIDNMKQ